MCGIDFAISSSFAMSSSYVEKIRSPSRETLIKELFGEISNICSQDITPETGTNLKNLVDRIDNFLSFGEDSALKNIKEALENYQIVVACPFLPATVPLAEDKIISKYARDVKVLAAKAIDERICYLCPSILATWVPLSKSGQTRRKSF